MKNTFEFKIVLLLGLVSLIHIFPISYVDGAKFQSGVTIKADTPADQCVDTDQNGVDDNTGQHCTGGKAPAQAPAKCVDTDQNGVDDNTGAACTGGQAPAGTCGLRILNGVPINYGELSIGQESGERMVEIINEGTSQTPAKVMIKGGDWLSDELVAGAHVRIAGPEVTKVSTSQSNYAAKTSLSDQNLELAELTGGQSLPINFQFKLENSPSTSVGAFHQDVTIDLLC
jgi:hypothetical protein